MHFDNECVRPLGDRSGAERIRILVVSPPALSQVIEYLFHGQPEFEVVGSLSGLRSLEQEAERLLPELIVASVKPLRTGICRVVASIKRSSPRSKLILICPVRDFMSVARKCGADACLEHEKLVLRLLRTAQVLTERPQPAARPGMEGPYRIPLDSGSRKEWNQKRRTR